MLRSHGLALAGALASTLLAAPSAPAQDCLDALFWAAESSRRAKDLAKRSSGTSNGDGLPDLAVATYHLNSVQVSLRQPAGGYTSSYGTRGCRLPAR
jgi:hypothetical protein